MKLARSGAGKKDPTRRAGVPKSAGLIQNPYKIAGKAATKIGGRFIPGTGWVLSGIGIYETHNCARACLDGVYSDDEVPHQVLYNALDIIWDPLLDFCGY